MAKKPAPVTMDDIAAVWQEIEAECDKAVARRHRRTRPWSDREDELIREWYMAVGPGGLATIFAKYQHALNRDLQTPRTAHAISSRADRLGIRPSAD